MTKKRTAGIPGTCLKKQRTARVQKLRKAQMDRRANNMPPVGDINRLGRKVPPYNREHITDPIDAIRKEYGSMDEYYEDQYERQMRADTSGIMGVGIDGGFPGEDEWDDWTIEREMTYFRRKTKRPSKEELEALHNAISKPI